MNIFVESPPSYKGDIYCFTWDFGEWLEKEIGSCVEESEAFAKKFGRDWALTFGWNRGTRVKSPKVAGPWIDRKYKKIRWVIEVPRFKYASPNAKSYVPRLREFLETVIAVLTSEQINTSKIQGAIPVLLQRFSSQPKMLKHDPHPYTYGTPEDPYGLKAKGKEPALQKPEVKAPAKFVKRKLPQWKISKNIAKCVEEEAGAWELERFDPILLTVMSGTSFRGRKIPLAWQMEFDPSDDRLAAARQQIKASGIEPDGDGWAEAIEKKFAKRYPKIADELHSDSESSTCALWVESESACRKLVEIVWSLIYAK